MRLIIFGSHGSGKGTQSKKVAEHYKIPVISTGEVIRHNMKKNTELGKLVRKYLDDNKYVPDELMNPIIGHMVKHDTKGFVLDGYPRTIAQAEFLDRLLKGLNIGIDVVINLIVPQDELVKRLLERGIKEERSEDTQAGIKSRMLEYKHKAEPVLEYYKQHAKVVDINGNHDVEKVFKDIKEVLDKVDKMERTLVVVKPDGIKRGLIDEIIKRYEKAGLKIIAKKTMQADAHLLQQHYSAHVKKPFYKVLEVFMSNGPVVAMIVEGEDAVALVRKMTGATDPTKAEKGTIRGDLGIDSLEKADREGRAIENLVHASGTKEEAKKEIKLWFG